MGNQNLVFEDLALAVDLLENLHSLISSSLNNSNSLPEDHKIKYLISRYGHLARDVLSKQPILQKRKPYKKLAEDLEEFLPQLDQSLKSDRLSSILPPDLQNSVQVIVDPSLSGNTVRVYYEVKEGLVDNIHIRAGQEANANEIKLHVPTVRLMERYSGLLGRIRLLLKRVRNWITQNGEPPIGSRAWEAKLEIEKLERILKERLEREAKQGIDLVKAISLEEEIKYLSEQLQRHQQTLDKIELNPGVGYVAAEGLPKIKGVENSEEALFIVNQISKEIQDHSLTQKYAQKILDSEEIKPGSYNSKTGKTAEVAHYIVHQDNNLPSFSSASQQMKHRGLWKTERVTFEGQPDTEIARRQVWGRVSNKIVYGITSDGKVDSSRLNYESIAEELGEMGGDPNNPNDRKIVASVIDTWMRERIIVPGFDPNTIAKVTSLMYGQEAQRNPATNLTAPMTLELVLSGEKNWQEAIEMFPMSQDGAVQQNRELNTYLEKWQKAKEEGIALPSLEESKSKQARQAREAMRKNLELIKAYMDIIGLDKFNLEQLRKFGFGAYNLPLSK